MSRPVASPDQQDSGAGHRGQRGVRQNPRSIFPLLSHGLGSPELVATMQPAANLPKPEDTGL